MLIWRMGTEREKERERERERGYAITEAGERERRSE